MRTVSSCPALNGWRQCAATSRPLSDPSPEAIAWPIASAASPWSAYHCAARWCRARAIRGRPAQLVPEQAAEQVVIPEPAVLVVQRDQE
jgi:hypothetical protein